MNTWHVVLLGLLEGLTEFIPVSSTGHLLLAGYFLGFNSPGKTFEVLIQLGSILAILSVYSAKLLRLLIDLPSDPRSRRFVLAVLVAFLPAAVIGAGAHKYIKEFLFESPTLVCVTLIVGGVVLLAVDKMRFEPRYHDAMDFSMAMVPGVSRSGATIVSAMLLGSDKRAAAEFSFFLAMPTMAGAFAYDLYKNHQQMDSSNTLLVVIGFVTSFIAAWIVVRKFLDYVTGHGFALFAWWRILVGGMGLGALFVLGAASP